MAALGGQSFASSEDKVKPEVKETVKVEILSPEQEALFIEGKLSETVIKPIYTEAEQLIFTEQVKKMKNKD